MFFEVSRICVGRYLRIILENVGRPGKVTLTLGKAYHEETKTLSIKGFLNFGLSTYVKRPVVHKTLCFLNC